MAVTEAHLNVQILIKSWPSCLALSPQSSRVKCLYSCSQCVASQHCDLLPTSRSLSPDFSCQSSGEFNLHRSNFTVSVITNLIKLYLPKSKRASGHLSLSHGINPASSALCKRKIALYVAYARHFCWGGWVECRLVWLKFMWLLWGVHVGNRWWHPALLFFLSTSLLTQTVSTILLLCYICNDSLPRTWNRHCDDQLALKGNWSLSY